MIPPGTTVLQGLRTIDPSVVFAQSQQEAVSAAASADAVVAVVGEQAYAEGYGDNPAPALPRDQQALLAALESTGKPVIVVVLAGRFLGLGTTNEQDASALLMAYQGSTEAGQAIADVVYGALNPSGRLPASWPTDADARPSFVDGDGNLTAASPVGDQPKFFDQLPSTAAGPGSTYNPLFTFRFGLSYTTFAVDSLTVSGPSTRDGSVTASFTVRNVGGSAGTDIVPVFVQQSAAPVLVPPHRLVGFTRVDLIAGSRGRLRSSFWSLGWRLRPVTLTRPPFLSWPLDGTP
jgi:beta-glucosidase